MTIYVQEELMSELDTRFHLLKSAIKAHNFIGGLNFIAVIETTLNKLNLPNTNKLFDKLSQLDSDLDNTPDIELAHDDLDDLSDILTNSEDMAENQH